MLGISFLLAVGLLLVVVSIITSTVIISKQGDPGKQGNVGPQGSDSAALLTTQSGGTNSSQSVFGGKLIVTSTKDSMVEGTSALNPVFKSLTFQTNQKQILIGSESLVSALSVETPAVNRIVSLSTMSNAELVLSEGNQLIRGNKTLNKIVAKNNLVIQEGLIVAKQLQTQGSLLISNSKSETDASLRINNQNPFSGSESASVMIQGNSSLASTPVTVKQEGVLGLATYENKTATGFEFSNETDTLLTIENNQTWIISKEINQLLFGNGFGTYLNVTPSILTPIYTLPDFATDAAIVLSKGNQLVYGQKTLSNVIAQLIQPARNTQTLNQLVLGSALSSTTISAPPSTSRIITIPDPGTLLADFMLTEGNQTINGEKEFTGISFGITNLISLNANSNQLGLNSALQRTVINAPAPVTSRVYTVPDTLTNSNFVMTEGDQTINGFKTLAIFSSTNLTVENFVGNKLEIGATTNQIELGAFSELKISAPPAPLAVTYIIPENATQMEFVMTTGNQIIYGIKNFGNITFSEKLDITGNITSFTSPNVTSSSRQMSMPSGQFISPGATVILAFGFTDDTINWPGSPSPSFLVFPKTGRYACSYGVNFPTHNQGLVQTFMTTDINDSSKSFGFQQGIYNSGGFGLSLSGYGSVNANAGDMVFVVASNQTSLNMTILTGSALNFFNAYYLGLS